jgi:hypothetical protein
VEARLVHDQLVRLLEANDPHLLGANQEHLARVVYVFAEVGPAHGVLLSAQSDSVLVVFQCALAHSPHPPPGPGHSFPDWLLIVYQRSHTHSLRPPPWPGHSVPFPALSQGPGQKPSTSSYTQKRLSLTGGRAEA